MFELFFLKRPFSPDWPWKSLSGALAVEKQALASFTSTSLPEQSPGHDWKWNSGNQALLQAEHRGTQRNSRHRPPKSAKPRVYGRPLQVLHPKNRAVAPDFLEEGQEDSMRMPSSLQFWQTGLHVLEQLNTVSALCSWFPFFTSTADRPFSNMAGVAEGGLQQVSLLLQTP